MIVLEELKRRDHETRETATDLYRNLVIEATERELTADDADTVLGVLDAAQRTAEQFEQDITKRREMLELEGMAAPLSELERARRNAIEVRQVVERKHADAIARLTTKHAKEMDEAKEIEKRADAAWESARKARNQLQREFPASELLKPTPDEIEALREWKLQSAKDYVQRCEKSLADAEQRFQSAANSPPREFGSSKNATGGVMHPTAETVRYLQELEDHKVERRRQERDIAAEQLEEAQAELAALET